MKEEIKIGLIGGGMIGRVHVIAYNMLQGIFADKLPKIRYSLLAEESLDKAETACKTLGFENFTDNWLKVIESDVDVVDVVVPNFLHKEIVEKAIQKGKHIFCEKPLALNSYDAKVLADEAQKKGIIHMVGFNYRKTPALILIKKWIEEGILGDIVSFQGNFSQDWAMSDEVPLSWRFQRKLSGSGSLGDLGSHIIDIARYLVGEIIGVSCIEKTVITERMLGEAGLMGEIANSKSKGPVDVDDITCCLVKFKEGAVGTLFFSRFCSGRKNFLSFELSGTKANVVFNWEKANEVQISKIDDSGDQSGFKTIQVGGVNHPYGDRLWPVPGCGIGFGEPFAIQFYEFLSSVQKQKSVAPNFYDGWKVNKIIDDCIRSAKSCNWVEVNY
jgi:predicted dehydrogenase